jgi:hypothetical protein
MGLSVITKSFAKSGKSYFFGKRRVRDENTHHGENIVLLSKKPL